MWLHCNTLTDPLKGTLFRKLFWVTALPTQIRVSLLYGTVYYTLQIFCLLNPFYKIHQAHVIFPKNKRDEALLYGLTLPC